MDVYEFKLALYFNFRLEFSWVDPKTGEAWEILWFNDLDQETITNDTKLSFEVCNYLSFPFGHTTEKGFIKDLIVTKN